MEGEGVAANRGEHPALKGPLFEELTSWSTKDLLALYRSPYAVCCLLRCMPTSSRHLIFRILYLPATKDKPLPGSKIRASFKSSKAYQDSTACLLKLRILERTLEGGGAYFNLNPIFAQNLRHVAWADLTAPFGTESPRGTNQEELERHGAKRWESVLHFLVGMDPGSQPAERPSKKIVKALQRTALLSDTGGTLKITNKGFQFLLKDPYSQVWIILLDLVNAISSNSADAKRELLLLLFQMSFCTPGHGYPLSALSQLQVESLDIMNALGIIYRDPAVPDIFFPTSVGRRLVAQTGAGGRTDGQPVSVSLGKCEIIAETNFRIYAYTNSRLQVDLMSMFVHMRIRLPNLAVGHITNESIRMALQNGITSDQIIRYLNAHCSPRSKGGKIPSNVSQMIRLWQAEKERVMPYPSVLLDKFESVEAFHETDKYANELGSKLWSSEAQRIVVVRADAEEAMRKFVRSNGIR